MVTKRTPTTDMSIGSVGGEDEYSFEEKVAAETAALESVIASGGDVEKIINAPSKDFLPVGPKGLILPIAFKKEVMDMALDAIVRLHGKPWGEEVIIKNGDIELVGCINPEGTVCITWKGIVKLP